MTLNITPAIMLTGFMLTVGFNFFVMMHVIKQNDVMLSVVMLSVVMQSVVMQSVVMLSVVMLNVVMLRKPLS
jgi:hypothetical protein